MALTLLVGGGTMSPHFFRTSFLYEQELLCSVQGGRKEVKKSNCLVGHKNKVKGNLLAYMTAQRPQKVSMGPHYCVNH